MQHRILSEGLRLFQRTLKIINTVWTLFITNYIYITFIFPRAQRIPWDAQALFNILAAACCKVMASCGTLLCKGTFSSYLRGEFLECFGERENYCMGNTLVSKGKFKYRMGNAKKTEWLKNLILLHERTRNNNYFWIFWSKHYIKFNNLKKEHYIVNLQISLVYAKKEKNVFKFSVQHFL